MDQNMETLSHFMSSHQYLMKLTQFLVSVSVFSLLFAQSPLLNSLLHSFNFFYFSAFPVQIFSHTIDKNCMFLLCNGLVVFLAKYSKYDKGLEQHENDYTPPPPQPSSSSSSSSFVLQTTEPLMEKEVAEEIVETSHHDHHRVDVIKEESKGHESFIEKAVERETKWVIMEVEEDDHQQQKQQQQQQQRQQPQQQDQDHESDDFVVVDKFVIANQQEDNDTDTILYNEEPDEEEEEEEEEEGNGLLTTEELNKKFDDFIRKMKQELRIEAQRQLVMVQ